MEQTTLILLTGALSVGFIHTALGPDHYLPFIVLAKARNWSVAKTTIITLLCGIGHILSGALLGLVAVAIGFSVMKLKFIELWRGEVAAWLLIIFGFVYFIWGLHRALKKYHHHHHEKMHSHHKSFRELTPWILFIIFILGPCEPLIPLVMYPAINGSILEVFLITLFFGLATLAVMLFIVLASSFGFEKLKFRFLERYGNALAGIVICSSGLAIKFLGL
jgi:nickel/cobalt transporter (NicO) family protein